MWHVLESGGEKDARGIPRFQAFPVVHVLILHGRPGTEATRSTCIHVHEYSTLRCLKDNYCRTVVLKELSQVEF